MDSANFSSVSKDFENFLFELSVNSGALPDTHVALVALMDVAEKMFDNGNKDIGIFLEFMLRLEEAHENNLIDLSSLGLTYEYTN